MPSSLASRSPVAGCVSEFVALGRGEDDADSQAGAHLGSIEVHPSMGGVGRRRQVLGLGQIDEEVGQCLGLDGGAGLRRRWSTDKKMTDLQNEAALRDP